MRYIEASWKLSSAGLSGISISLWPGVFLLWSLLERHKSLHSWSRCLWCTRITILPSSNSSWVRFKKVTSSPGFDMSSMEIACFDCSEGTSCFIAASRLPTIRRSSTWTIRKQSPFFPECVARVPASLWGSGGWGCVRSTLRLRSQPFTTVRNRSQPFARSPHGRAYGKFCRRDHFWRFQTSRCFVSRGRRGTSWHSDVFCNVSKMVLCGRRNTFATFSEDAWQFSWQAQHFGRVHRHFAWQAQHFRRVVLRVFCKSHWQGCVKWRQGADSVASVAFSEMCWKLTEASHETSIWKAKFHVPEKTRRKTSILKLRRFWKLEEGAREMLVLVLPRLSSRVTGFPVASPCLWGKRQSLSFSHVSNCGNWWTSRTKCSFWCSPLSRLESLVFWWLCLWRKVQNLSFSKVFKQVVMSFCVAGVALCDIPTCFIPCRKCQNWREARTKCSFCCAHVSHLESLVFLWPRRVYGGSCKTFPLKVFNCQNWRKSRTKCLFCCSHVPRLESLVFLWPRRVYGGSSQSFAGRERYSMLDGEERVEIALGELRWEGARQHAGRTGSRANSLRRASLGGSETAFKPWKWLGESSMQSCWCSFFRAVGTVFSGQMSSLRLSWNIVDGRLVKRSQDRSNGFQRQNVCCCSGFRFALNRGKMTHGNGKYLINTQKPNATFFRCACQHVT